MENDQTLQALYALTTARLAEIKATQEIILKAQSHLLAALIKEPWEQLFEDFQAQAAEAAEVYREQTLNEMKLLQKNRINPPADE